MPRRGLERARPAARRLGACALAWGRDELRLPPLTLSAVRVTARVAVRARAPAPSAGKRGS